MECFIPASSSLRTCYSAL